MTKKPEQFFTSKPSGKAVTQEVQHVINFKNCLRKSGFVL